MMHTLAELYLQQLEDLHGAEAQLCEALPTMLLAAAHKDLKVFLENYAEQSLQRRHVLEQLLTVMGHEPGSSSSPSPAMRVILTLGDEMISNTSHPDVRDAGLATVAQRGLHYQTAVYGSVVPMADLLKRKNDRHCLGNVLRDCREASEVLSKISVRTMHRAAAALSEDMAA
jgi:ferritin-like metal-binding protein YciE